MARHLPAIVRTLGLGGVQVCPGQAAAGPNESLQLPRVGSAARGLR